ncbi:MAG: hypothetical protein E6I20_06035 [Chloroflexi bacterium]|nr:MAG: hypothetical protein E6I20_06035 [Chloroflexota bacterium]
MRIGLLRWAMSFVSRASAVTSASVPGGRSTTPARTATSDAESSMVGAIRIGRIERSTASA